MNPTQSSHEEWRPVPGYEGIYEVSDQGRVRSLDRIIDYPRGKRRIKGRDLKLNRGGHGYMSVGLARSGETKASLVHCLVLRAFVGPRPSGMDVCHGNGDPLDNRLTNLRYGTRGDNVRDSVTHGTNHWASKAECPRGHALAEPNLVECAKRRGSRECLACSRAQSYITYHTEMKPHMKQVADSYYDDIMKGTDGRKRTA